MCCGESVVRKCWDECCREVLGKRGVEEVLGKRVAKKWWDRVL